MCDEKNNECLENEPEMQKIKIVKFDRAIPIIQLLAMAGVLILLAAILVENETSRIFLALALMMILVAIAWRVRRLYQEGLTFEVEYIDEEHPTRLAIVAEEVPDSEDDELAEENDEENSASQETEKETHWTEQDYPDPDVELGLKPPPDETPEEEKKQ